LAAWSEDDGEVGAEDVADEMFWDPQDHASEPVADPLDTPEQVAAGERMAIQLAATGSGYTVLPASVARMFGQKDVVVLPTSLHPGWETGLAWRRAADSALIQDFIGVTKGRRPRSRAANPAAIRCARARPPRNRLPQWVRYRANGQSPSLGDKCPVLPGCPTRCRRTAYRPPQPPDPQWR